jgi:hypothetical protein
MSAVQAQDFHAAKWALGLRLQNATDETIEAAFAGGEILRTHVLRPTWHFVTPADIRWLLKLTAPRVNAASRYYYRKHELDDAVFKRSQKVLAKALSGGNYLTRDVLRKALQRSGIVVDEALRFTLILFRAELDGLICSGPRTGKQFTYALLDERVPAVKVIKRDEALAELTRRYFTSHGPATSADFMWWSGLASADVKKGLEMVNQQLASEVIDGQIYWQSSSTEYSKRIPRVAYLLPTFDEYLVAYKDRSMVMDPRISKRSSSDNYLFRWPIVWDSRIVGTWNRKIERAAVTISINPLVPLNKTETGAIADAASRYGDFLNLTTSLQ